MTPVDDEVWARPPVAESRSKMENPRTPCILPTARPLFQEDLYENMDFDRDGWISYIARESGKQSNVHRDGGL